VLRFLRWRLGLGSWPGTQEWTSRYRECLDSASFLRPVGDTAVILPWGSGFGFVARAPPTVATGVGAYGRITMLGTLAEGGVDRHYAWQGPWRLIQVRAPSNRSFSIGAMIGRFPKVTGRLRAPRR
jgi:hypothetical protein